MNMSIPPLLLYRIMLQASLLVVSSFQMSNDTQGELQVVCGEVDLDDLEAVPVVRHGLNTIVTAARTQATLLPRWFEVLESSPRHLLIGAAVEAEDLALERHGGPPPCNWGDWGDPYDPQSDSCPWEGTGGWGPAEDWCTTKI
ncbi:hypothetical protein JB92DRAFT_1038481 [Gautieria morchelliformis]|nr:hypothetical protein JB92DRAFT_1038481 [Gautieria morchelliformis]